MALIASELRFVGHQSAKVSALFGQPKNGRKPMNGREAGNFIPLTEGLAIGIPPTDASEKPRQILTCRTVCPLGDMLQRSSKAPSRIEQHRKLFFENRKLGAKRALPSGRAQGESLLIRQHHGRRYAHQQEGSEPHWCLRQADQRTGTEQGEYAMARLSHAEGCWRLRQVEAVQSEPKVFVHADYSSQKASDLFGRRTQRIAKASCSKYPGPTFIETRSMSSETTGEAWLAEPSGPGEQQGKPGTSEKRRRRKKSNHASTAIGREATRRSAGSRRIIPDHHQHAPTKATARPPTS